MLTANLTAAQADAGLVATGRVKVGAALSATQANATISASGIAGTPAWLTRTAANATISATASWTVNARLSATSTATLSAGGYQAGTANLSLTAANATLYANEGITHARASQVIIASLQASNLAYTRASQSVAAVLGFAASPSLRATQIVIGAMNRGQARQRATQIVLEVLVWNYEVPMRAIFPVLPGLAYSVIKRPSFFNASAESISGREIRVAYAQYPLWEWDLTFDYLPDEPTASSATASDLKQLMGFYLSQGGSFGGFLFKDPDDYTVTAQVVGTTDGATAQYTLIRTYGGSDGTGSEPVGYVDTGAAFAVYLDGVLQSGASYNVVTTTPVSQVLAFTSAPASGHVITVTYTYYYYVRFKEDTYEFEKFMDKLWSQRLVTLKSLRG
jgi:hypothetical protein